MPKVNENYPIGDVNDLTLEELARIMTDMYRDLAVALNQKPDLIVRQTDGASTDTAYSVGTINVNESTNFVEVLTQHPTQTTVTWTPVS